MITVFLYYIFLVDMAVGVGAGTGVSERHSGGSSV